MIRTIKGPKETPNAEWVLVITQVGKMAWATGRNSDPFIKLGPLVKGELINSSHHPRDRGALSLTGSLGEKIPLGN